MTVKPFSKEELNFFKFSSIVLDEFPKALRQTFISMWGSKVGALPGYQVWDDSIAVRNMLLASEGGKTDIPINKSIQDWDSTALFKATIFAKTFVLTSSTGPKKTLAEFYLKGRKPKPSPFHPTVNSPSGDQDETLTLAIDQLRLLRNTLCHATEPRITKPDFDQYVQLGKDAFIAAKVPTASIDAIGCLSEADFPTTKVVELNDHLQKELQASNMFLQEKVIDKICDIDERAEFLYDQLIRVREVQGTTSEELKKIRSDLDDHNKSDLLETPNSLPESCLPAMVPHFTGRKEECENIMASMTSESTRLFSIWGSPGFGKTSTAIAIGHGLQSQNQSVYFFTFRGISTKDEFVSKLLSFFKRSPKSSVKANFAPGDELCRIFEEIRSPFFVILDNLDDLFACTKANYGNTTSVKDDVLRFIEEILGRCGNVRFLTTTRESLEFMCLKMDGNESLRIGPLDQPSSENLVCEFLSSATQDIRTQISQICGNVPLAIKLLCSFIKEYNETPRECLEYIRQSSESLLDIIDDPSYLTDLRLKQLIEFSFDKLSLREQDAFISLSVFAGIDFDLDAALAVIGGNKIQAKRSLRNLEKKSLIDFNIQSAMFSLHPLLQSFAFEKGEEMKSVVISSRTRFYEYYIDMFGNLNKLFMTGNMMMAFSKLYQEEQRIWLSLHEGFQVEGLCDKLFEILATAEMCLDTLLTDGLVKVESLYELASKKAQERGNDVAYASLVVSKCFFKTRYLSTVVITLPPEDTETEKKIHSLPAATKAKYLCYRGIYELSNGNPECALEERLLLLSDGAEHRILKIVALQLLALYYNFSNNSAKSTQFCKTAIEECKAIGDMGLFLLTSLVDEEGKCQISDRTTSPNKLLILRLISNLSVWARKYLCVQMKMNLRLIVQTLQTQVEEASPIWSKTLAVLFQICDIAVVYLSTSDEESPIEKTVQDIERAVEIEKSSASQVKGESGKTERQTLLEERLARCHHVNAAHHFALEHYALALQSYQNELLVRIGLPLHPELALCYSYIGVEQRRMGDYSSALQSNQRALDVRLQVYGEQHAHTAKSCFDIGVLHNDMGDHSAALRSHQRALDARLKHYGEQHVETSNSYYKVGVAKHNMNDDTSALRAFQRALEIRLKCYGEENEETAVCYEWIRIIQDCQHN